MRIAIVGEEKRKIIGEAKVNTHLPYREELKNKLRTQTI
jgi:hypothetical protein